MRIAVAKNIGFCQGVRRAVDMTLKAAESDNNVYTYGELIHNSMMINKLEKRGVKVIKDLNSVTPGDTVIIRTHGISEAEYIELNSRGVNIIDATCPFVKNIHNKVKEYSDAGYSIIVIGRKNHPEINGILGWCKDAQVIMKPEEADFSVNDKFYVVVQTTFDYNEYVKLARYIEISLRNLGKSVVIFNSICYTTKERQSEALNIAEISELVLIVGDKTSSNTMRLKELAEGLGKKVFLIEDVADLKSVNIQNKGIAGILAGASTPDELITEVITIMTNVNNDVVNQDEVETAQTEQIVANENKEVSFADMLKHYEPKQYREGKRVKVIVESADESGITVSIVNGGKNDSGFIAASEAEIEGVEYIPANYTKGLEIDAIIIQKTDKQKSINLSKKAYDEIKIDDEKVAGILEGNVFEMKIDKEVKGGLTGKIGTYVVFVPASEIKDRYVSNLGEYVGKVLKLKIAPPKAPKAPVEGEETAEEAEVKERRRNAKRIVASHKIVVEEEKKAKLDQFLSSIQINQIVEGKVKRFSPFGAFVSVNGHDCLVHVSQLANYHVTDPSEVLEIGKVYEFVVREIKEDGHVSLGYKDLEKERYDRVRDKYLVGTVVNGVVARVKKFNVFVKLEDGIEGKIHISQLGHTFVEDINSVIQAGQEVEAKVISFEGNEIVLSIKELLPAPEVVKPEEAPEEEAEVEKESKRAPRKSADKEGKKVSKRAKKEDSDDDEQREYVSNDGGATLADLFKGLNLDVDNK